MGDPQSGPGGDQHPLPALPGRGAAGASALSGRCHPEGLDTRASCQQPSRRPGDRPLWPQGSLEVPCRAQASRAMVLKTDVAPLPHVPPWFHCSWNNDSTSQLGPSTCAARHAGRSPLSPRCPPATGPLHMLPPLVCSSPFSRTSSGVSSSNGSLTTQILLRQDWTGGSFPRTRSASCRREGSGLGQTVCPSVAPTAPLPAQVFALFLVFTATQTWEPF